MISIKAPATARPAALSRARAAPISSRGKGGLRVVARLLSSPSSSSCAAPSPARNNNAMTSSSTTTTKRSIVVARAGGGGGGGGGAKTLSRGGGGLGGAGAVPEQIDEPALSADSYVAIGLAVAFERDDGGKLSEKLVIEPISASSLECMANGARTSFRFAAGTTLGALMRGGSAGDALPEEYAGASLCQNWARRVEAAARTWQRPHAQDHLMDIAPLPPRAAAGGAGGPARAKARGGFNFSLDDKRVLNSVNVVTDADNVKQDISIDVYGRAEAAEAAAAEEAELGGGDDAHARAEAVRAGLTAPCDHMGPGSNRAADDSSDDEDELDALLAA
jgi:hypothetical protein